MSDQPSDSNLLNLFRQEAENHTQAMSQSLIEWENNLDDLSKIEPLMRAAHSLKGAAKIVGIDPYSNLAHVLEDCFVAAQKGDLKLGAEHFDTFLQAIDFMGEVIDLSPEEMTAWPGSNQTKLDGLISSIQAIQSGKESSPSPPTPQEETQAPQELQTDDATFTLFASQTQSNLKKIGSILEQFKANTISEALIGDINTAAISIESLGQVANIPDASSLAQEIVDTAQKLNPNAQPVDKEIIQSIESLCQKLSELTQPSKPEAKTPEPTPTPKAPTKAPFEKQREIEHREISVSEEDTAPKPKKKVTLQELSQNQDAQDQVVRVSARNLNRLMGLAAESLIETRRLQPVKEGLLQLKALHRQLVNLFNTAHTQSQKNKNLSALETTGNQITENAQLYRNLITEQIDLFDTFSRNNSLLSTKLYDEVLKSRMRPFSEGVQGFPRLVRNLSRSLNKKFVLEITGKETPVDRDILEKLEAPLNHIIRNACDHGIEAPQERTASGKDEKGTIKIHAHHSAGMLLLSISDDGAGINKDKLRKKILKKELLTKEMAATLTDDELMDFLFLPGFSTTQEVTDISGRGVGLDVVRNLMQEIGGNVRVESKIGKGTTFFLHLPVTRSVIRALLVEINNEPYAFPLSRIHRTLRIPRKEIHTLERHAYFHLEGENIATISAHQALGFGHKEPDEDTEELQVVILEDKDQLYSLVVTKVLGETELVVRPLDPRLGKVPCISSASISDEGHPVLILDVDDLLSSIEKLLIGGDLSELFTKKQKITSSVKTVLIVDDSLTVRETERQLLQAQGYNVAVALDGADGWNTLRSGEFDLIVTDIDMPRMNGFELIELIKADDNFKNIPIIIVSYKDREEDRVKGMQVGADFYLTKSSFRDHTFIDAVKNLIGNPEKE